MNKEKYYPPKYTEEQFHCPHCGVYAKQLWSHMKTENNYRPNDPIGENVRFEELMNTEWTVSKCTHCSQEIIWFNDKIIYPKKIVVGLPNEDLSEEIKKDYLEAATIFHDSIRSSAALLRLALQKLCKQLGEKGDNINEDIKKLVKKGLNSQIQRSLDILRITGNNAVHPGQINIEEKPKLVLKLFDLINFIAEKMITEPKEIEKLYEDELPKSAKEQIEQRDNKK